MRRMGIDEFNDEQIRRVDEVYNAAMEFVRVLTNNLDLEYNMGLIGEMVDDAVASLNGKGFDVYFPSIVYDERGTYTVDKDSEILW